MSSQRSYLKWFELHNFFQIEVVRSEISRRSFVLIAEDASQSLVGLGRFSLEQFGAIVGEGLY